MKRSLLWTMAGLLISTGAMAATAPADLAAGKQKVEAVCAACHGVDGNSVASANPSLAGQPAQYIEKQLKEFKAGTRKNPIMMGMAATLNDDDVRNVAAYLASQKIKPRDAGNKDLANAGKAIYRGGIAAKGVPACMACHGPAGAGQPAQYPRLGAQHAAYIEAQLKAFASGERANDQNSMMRDIAARMTEKDMKAVAEYVTGLR